MQLHVPSLVVGVAAAAVLLVSMSQTTPSSGPPRIEYGPNPRDMVQIKEGTPFTVPVGKVFVLTGLGGNRCSGSLNGSLRVNGQNEVGWLADHSPSVQVMPVGFTVAAGSTIDVVGQPLNQFEGRAWGYLADR